MNRITCRGVDITEHVRTMFDLAVSSRGYDNEPMYSLDELEQMMIAGHLAGLDIDDISIDLPIDLERPEYPRQQYFDADGVLKTRSYEEHAALVRAHYEATAKFDVEYKAESDRAIAAWRAQIAAKAEALAAATVAS